MAERLRRTPKYKHLSEDTLHRVADWAIARHKAPRDAIKAAKRKLHQVYGAYFDRVNFTLIEGLIHSLSPTATEDALRETCRKVLACHASTAERIAIMEDFFPALFREVGRPGSILDLACGLNPFALPWMGLGLETEYWALDVDGRLIAAINDFLAHIGRPPGASCRDLLVSPLDEDADVAFLLKTIPCLEQQERGAGLRLLRGLRARYAVVSFPGRSLGGRDKGMGQHYDRIMMGMAEELGAPVHKMAYPGETFYICQLKEMPPIGR